MSRVTKTICDRCGEEIVYRGWTSKLHFAKKFPFRFRILKLKNGNPSGYDYSELDCELCAKCTMKLSAFLRGGEIVNDQREAD